ncbi:aminotransferase class V-fold PLP-dependent enzyme [Paracoccus sp. MBLB3053]|uniref:Aminotransferase class V-fold PLP-dependent enzyme n=1 Tax=Paracoccus aurantius TaxID=3073814 RepID=A0ABU2HWB6_9RHOB|nr:aminotransferase class V-fold PLP-dependent enzyme [Paracoccus sp. MBLB3053]MDS9469351.1 aminotransferase class V-fold PLP-dependent enzyme [Paracoccus sp. MBLB3053]
MKDMQERHFGENEDWSWHRKHGYSPVINVSGTMTGLGASRAAADVASATAEAMGHFLKIHEIQTHASRVIAALTGAEAGCLTASASAGISLSIAGCMTGLNPARAEALPRDPGPRSEVAVQMGHLCGYGAPISTAIELTGATVRQIGQSTLAMDHQLEAALGPETAAALYVVSHHVVHYGQIPLRRFAEICHSNGVPVIVDAASEYDLRGFLQDGADLVIYSGHKFLGGPTSGIIAGRRDLVRAAYLQNMGIGRGMKIGKESMAGAIRAMERWMERDHAAIRAEEKAALDLWMSRLAGMPGILPRIVADPTRNPLDRLQVEIDPAQAGTTAAAVCRHLGELDPAIIVRDHETELGYFQLDPCNLAPGQAEMVGAVLAEVLRDAASIPVLPGDDDRARNGGARGYLGWLAEA